MNPAGTSAKQAAAVRVVLAFSLALASWASATSARAQHVCNPKKEDCGCEKNWGCWELWFTTRGTVLGLRATASYVGGNEHSRSDVAGGAAYLTEHYGTRPSGLSGHLALFGAISGGSARTEGELSAAIDFGFRGGGETRGFFLRMGPSFTLLGNHRLELALLSPLEARAGYQLLDGARLIEWGVAFGPLVSGHFAAYDVRRSLAPSWQLRAYAALRWKELRVDLSASDLRAASSEPGDPVWLLRALTCSYSLPVALCADASYLRGDVHVAASRDRLVHVFHAGVIVGFTP